MEWILFAKKVLLSHSLRLRDEGWKPRTEQNEFHACAHTFNFAPLQIPLLLSLSGGLTHTQTHTIIVHLCICSIYTCKGFCFPHVCGIKGAFGV